MNSFNKTVLLFFLASTALWQGCAMNEQLKSTNSVSPYTVIMKAPEEVMFSQQELETLWVALNPEIAGLKPVISQELGTSAAVHPGKQARYSIKSMQRKYPV